VLFGSGNTGDMYPGGNPENKEIGPVLCDTYTKKEIAPDPSNPKLSVAVGAPILYFRVSRTSNTFNTDLSYGNIYNYQDNRELIDLGNMRLQPAQRNNTNHHFGSGYVDPDDATRTGKKIFYEAITNPVIKVGVRPYNPDTYILISAGYDGIYGTKDDVTNFGM
jgi:hypothetical protein